MSRASTVLLGSAYIAVSVADTLAAGRTGTATGRRLRTVLKPALMPTLGAAFLDATRGERRPGTARLRAGTLAAQGFSWGGDVALLGSSKRSFLIGVGSFFAAHIAYVAAFSSVRGEREEYDVAGLRLAIGLWLTLAPVMSVAAGRKDPGLRGPVAAYASILCGMFASSRLLDPALPAEARRALQAGTALFLVSDTALATQKFVLDEPMPALESLVMATYTAGQGLIAVGAAGAS